MPVKRRPERQKEGEPAPWLVSVHYKGRRDRFQVDGRLTKRQAESLEEEAYQRLVRARGRERGPATVEDFLDGYWHEHGRHLASAPTEDGYLDRWAEALGPAKPILDVTAGDITRAIASWRTTDLSPSTINHYIGCLQRAWRRGTDLHGWPLAPVPFARLKLDEPEQPDRSLTAAELARYLGHLPRRSLPITEPVLAVLTMMGALPEVGRIFAITVTQLRKDRERARKLAGLPDFRQHDLRHTFAQALEDAGVGDAITAALHHSDPRLRHRYSRARLHRTGAAIEAAFAPRRATNGN